MAEDIREQQKRFRAMSPEEREAFLGQPEEAGAEEGDWLDYMPFGIGGLGKRGAKMAATGAKKLQQAAAQKAKDAAKEAARKAAKEKLDVYYKQATPDLKQPGRIRGDVPINPKTGEIDKRAMMLQRLREEGLKIEEIKK